MIPELLIWLQDINWPGANKIAELLILGDGDLVEHIKYVFNSKDNIWIYWVLSKVVGNLPRDIVSNFKKEILNLVSSWDLEETTDLLAMEVLAKFGYTDEIKEIYIRKKYTIENYFDEISNLEKYFN